MRNRSLSTMQGFTQRGFRYLPDLACDPKRTKYACRRAAMILAIVALGVTFLVPRTALPQSTGDTPVEIDPAAGTMPELGPEIEPGDGTARRTGRSVTPLVAPVPFKNTQLGWGLMLMGGLIHRFDADTSIKPSTGVVGAFYTENGSWGVMAMENARLAGDRWRLRLMVGHPEVRYDYYGIGEDAGNAGRSVEIQQNMNLATVAALGRVANNVYLGGTALYLGASTAVRDTAGLGLPPAAADISDMQLFAVGLQGEADTRNDDYWPTHGTLARLKAWFFVDALGGERSFQRYVLFWSWYAPVRGERLVLATNLNASGASDDAPFWALPAVGFGRGGLRGYTQGRYRDAVMTTEQAELRYHSAGRFGATVFVGFGHVAPTFGDIFKAQVLPAGGLGLRYQLTQKFPMHMRFDYSWGRDGSLFYFGVSEAF
ncbi:MAG: BamA/TamA family outer membrane protein [bacterium]